MQFIIRRDKRVFAMQILNTCFKLFGSFLDGQCFTYGWIHDIQSQHNKFPLLIVSTISFQLNAPNHIECITTFNFKCLTDHWHGPAIGLYSMEIHFQRHQYQVIAVAWHTEPAYLVSFLLASKHISNENNIRLEYLITGSKSAWYKNWVK